MVAEALFWEAHPESLFFLCKPLRDHCRCFSSDKKNGCQKEHPFEKSGQIKEGSVIYETSFATISPTSVVVKPIFPAAWLFIFCITAIMAASID